MDFLFLWFHVQIFKNKKYIKINIIILQLIKLKIGNKNRKNNFKNQMSHKSSHPPNPQKISL